MLRFLTYVAVASVSYSIYEIGSQEIASLESGSSNAALAPIPKAQPKGQVAATGVPGVPLAPAQRSQGGRAKIILFTGTQWCQPCRHLESQVINTMPWREFTRGEVSFQKIDVPRDSAMIRNSDRELLSRYGIKSFPTLIVVDVRGHEHGRRSGASNDPREVVNWARGITSRL